MRAAWVCVAAAYGALLASAFSRGALALAFLVVAGAAFLPIWAKWRFSPLRLPVALLVPFGLVAALVRGWFRVRSGPRG